MYKLNSITVFGLVALLSLTSLTLQERIADQEQQQQRSQKESHLETNDTSPRPRTKPTNSTTKQHKVSTTTNSASNNQSLRDQEPLTRLANDNRQQRHPNISGRSQHLDDISHRLDQTEQNVTQEMDTRVPLWNIAHMINSIEQIELALSAGSNGIETDVSFDMRGFPVEAYHGFPCDCGRHCHHREDFVKFVSQLARVTVPPASSRLQVVLFDLKLKELKSIQQKETAGRALAEIIYKNLYEPYQKTTNIRSRQALEQNLFVQPPLRVVVSINHSGDVPLVKAFIKFMRDNRLDFMSQQVGFDIGMNDPLSEISAAWDSLNGASFNIWQGDGLTNCANIVRGVERLKEAIRIRNSQGHFRKVYYWTADIMYHIRSVLRLGVDAVLTNQPQRVVQVLREKEFRNKFRLATPWDNPFEQFWIEPSASKVKPPTLGEAVETIANIQRTSQNFIKTIPDGISAVVKKVHRSIRFS